MRGLNLPALKDHYRIALWALLVLLTLSILLFPTHLTFEYYPIQSTRIFDSLPLFAILYCIWLLVLLLLLFSRRGEGESEWEKLALVCIFSAVFLGFWTIVTHSGLSNEGVFNAAHVRYLEHEGNIPVGHPSLSYFDFPGLHLIGSFVSQSTGLDAIGASAFIVFFQAVLLAALLYVLFRRLLNSAYVAPLAVLLVIQGNISLDKLNIFHPRNLGVLLLVAFLVLLSRHRLFGTAQDRLFLIILLAAVTMTHAVTAFLLFFIMLGIYVVQKLDRTNVGNSPPVIIFLVFPVAWAMYWAVITFEGLMGTFPKVLDDLAERSDVLWFLTMMGKANVGERLPLWSNISRLSWWVVIYGFGTILGLGNLFRLKKLSPMEKRTTGVLLGVIMISVVSTLASGGGARFDTYILYGAFAIVPILLGFLLSLRNHIRRYAFVCLVSVFFVLSFPTFLSHNNMVEFDAWHPDEHASGKFLESQFTQGENLHIYSGEWIILLTPYYLPEVRRVTSREIFYMKDEAGLWAQIDSLTTGFEGQRGRPEDSIFVWSKRLMLPYQHFFGIAPEHPRWQELRDRLSYQNRIYDNGNVELFGLVQEGM
jgi:hypothetical protein